MSLDNFKYNLQRLKECDQYWDEMMPKENGRHCSKCSRTIVDFSGMSFAEIALYMSGSNRPICGFYLPEQVTKINKPLQRIPVALGLSTVIATAALAQPHASLSNAIQKISSNEDGYHKDMTVSPTDDSIKVDTFFINGRVEYFDTLKKSNQPIPFASIVVKGKSYGVTTDMEGNFKLRCQMSDTPVTILVTSVGFVTYQITNIVGNEKSEVDLGAIVLRRWEAELIEFRVSVKKRSAFDRFWRKVTKPFRS